MRKPTIYLETTVPNFVFNNHLPEEQKIARNIFRNVKQGKIKAVISEIVIREINRASEPRRSRMKRMIRGIKVLKLTSEAENLAKIYVQKGVIPKNKIEDAFHIAIASVAKIDILASWNLEHIVKAKTKFLVEQINTQSNHPTPIIVRPEEVL